jgi:uncharacterized membrane protein YedE/YeeE
MTSSPYVIGGALGLLNAFAFATAKRGLGVTTAFESTAALAGREVAPDAMNVNAYVAKREETPKVDWESLLVVGMLAGSYLAAHATSDPPTRAVPPSWSRRFGPSRAKRNAAAFVGGAVMMFGARMAKGCTSGHTLTGTAQLAVSSWVFSPLMFATAAGVTRLLYGKEVRR